MRDEEVREMFAALDAEPQPTFIATLRDRLEREWPDADPVRGLAGERYVPSTDIDVGDMIDSRETVAETGSEHDSARRWVYAVGSVAAVSLVIMLMMVVRSPDVESPATVPVTAELPSPSTLPVVVGVGDRVRARIPVENTADSIAIADDAVWVSGWDGSLVSRIDVDTNEVVTVDVGSTGTHVSSGGAGVWVGVDGGKVLRLDPLTAQVLSTVDIGGASAAPLSGDDAVWVVTPESSMLTRVDAVTNEVTATIDVSASGIGTIENAIVADGKVWVSSCEGGVVSVDEQTLAVSEPIGLDGCVGTLGFTDDSLWVALEGQRTVRVDPVTGAVAAVVEIGPTDGAPFMATGDGAVWVPVTTGTVARIDTATNTVTDIVDLGRTGQAAGLGVGHGSLWAGDYNQTTVLRIDL